ncbi:MAG TPA: hypothetical protein VF341_04065, partial [Anaeromyxobacteraceae bacterium]
ATRSQFTVSPSEQKLGPAPAKASAWMRASTSDTAKPAAERITATMHHVCLLACAADARLDLDMAAPSWRHTKSISRAELPGHAHAADRSIDTCEDRCLREIRGHSKQLGVRER